MNVAALGILRTGSQNMRGESKTDEYEVSDVVGDFQGLDSDRPLCQGGLSCVLSCTSIVSAAALTIMESSSTRNKSYKLRCDSNLLLGMLFVQTIGRIGDRRA